MSALTIAVDFAVARISKSGKTTYRGALGVITSGNATERATLAMSAVQHAVDNNNFRHLMREVVRVFPESIVKKAANVMYRDGELHFVNDTVVDGVKTTTLERFDASNPNKVTSHLYAKAVISVLTASAKEIKGEKKLYANMLADMLDRETQRLAALSTEAVEPSAEVVDA